MEKIEEFVDQRLKAWCIHCGEWIESRISNRDHAPSRALLLEPYPDNLPQVEVCKACNESFSLDEEYLAAFLSCVLTGSTDPAAQKNPRATRILTRSTKLRARIESAKTEQQTLWGKTEIIWEPEKTRVDRIVLKNARGHAYYEYGTPMLEEPQYIWTFPLPLLTDEQRKNFENIYPAGLNCINVIFCYDILQPLE